MAQYASEGSVRLSTPTITPRPTPMPILNLPMLPLPTPQIPPEPAATQSPVRLRSMPILAMNGYDDADEADHENAGLDEMEMMDEMDETMEDEDAEGEDEGDTTGAEHTSTSRGSPEVEMEVPTMGRRLRSPLPPSLSHTPGGGSPGMLPRIDTTPLGISFRASPDTRVERPGTQYFTPTDPVPPDVLRTPIPAIRKAGASAPGEAVVDYFNAKVPERTPPLQAQGSPNLIDLSRTPRPEDGCRARRELPEVERVRGYGAREGGDTGQVVCRWRQLTTTAEQLNGVSNAVSPTHTPPCTPAAVVHV